MRAIPTLEEVAREAGVSRSTVSRVINNDAKVAPKARASVSKAIAKLGYVPNEAARRLVKRRTDSFAVVVDESDGTLFENPFFGLLLTGLGEKLDAAGLTLVMLMGKTAGDELRTETYLRGGHVDGAVFASLQHGEGLPGRLHQGGFPVVLAGRPLRQLELPYADVDNEEGGRLAARHLIERGRTRLATITGRRTMVAAEDRLRGFSEVAAAHHLRVESRDGGFSLEQAQAVTTTLLAEHPDIDAIFAASDPMALGVMAALRAAKRRIPDDVAVVSFDGTMLSSVAQPPLTVVVQPARELGAALADLVVAVRRGEPVAPVVLPVELVQGATS